MKDAKNFSYIRKDYGKGPFNGIQPSSPIKRQPPKGGSAIQPPKKTDK